MSYQAPRQGMFAIIILLSLCLHVLFFVVSYERGVHATQRVVSSELAVNLADNAVLPMHIDDRVGLSVLASEVVEHPLIAYVAVYDSQDHLLVPAGNDVASDVSVTESIFADGQMLGKVVVKAVPVSRSGVFSEYWPFLLATLVLHALIWLLYGHVARPSDALIDVIARDARNHLLDSGVLLIAAANTKTETKSNHDDQAADKPKGTAKTVADVLRGRGIAVGGNALATPTAVGQSGNESSDAQRLSAEVDNDLALAANHVRDGDDGLVVQLAFDDADDLLSVLAQDKRDAYLALCNQLIEKSLTHALAQPLLDAVVLSDFIAFSDTQKQALIYLKADAGHAKTALVAAMLVKLMVVINQVVYEKHRELSYFALPMKAVACHQAHVSAATLLLKKRAEHSLLMLNADELASLKPYMDTQRLDHPASIHERECVTIVAMSASMDRKIINLRNDILLSA